MSRTRARPRARAPRGGAMSRRIVSAVEDLFFAARIAAAAKAAGATLVEAPLAGALEAVRAGPTRRVLVDLHAARALDLVKALKADPALAGVEVVGFYSHVDTEIFRAAKAAGIDRALARSAFTTLLPGLLGAE